MNNPNTQEQAEQDTPTGGIKFIHAPAGNIFFSQGHSIFPDLLKLGAFIATKKTNFTKECAWDEYATDADGLRYLEHKSDDATGLLADMISSLGIMLVHADADEVGEENMRNCQWIAAGLGEVLAQLIREGIDIRHSHRQLSEQPGIAKNKPQKNPEL